MRRIFVYLTTAALLATPAFAEARGFKSDLSAAISGPLKLEIVVSEDLAHRANNLPKKLSDRGRNSRLNSSFSNNGRYGEKEITYLIDDLEDELIRDFAKRNIAISEDAPTRLRITIESAKPNRPTFNQLSKDASLSFQSFGIGGAEVSAEFIGSNDEVLGTATYDYFPSFGETVVIQGPIWNDANRAFSRFSNKLSKTLVKNGSSNT